MKSNILSIDQGTTGSTVAIINNKGAVIAKSYHDFPQIFPKPGWVEHDPDQIWMSVLKGINDVTKKVEPHSIKAIGITNQRETIIAWDRLTGHILHNAIVWQCRRTSDICKRLRTNKPLVKKIRSQTGLVLDPYFSATKIQWLIKNNKKVREKYKKDEVCFGTVDSFLIMKLTAGDSFVTEPSNASRTLLFDINKSQWSEDLLKQFSIKRQSLATVINSDGFFGKIKNVPGLLDGIPIHGVLGDQQAALFGQTAFRIGEAKCTFGTGSFILTNTGHEKIKSRYGLLTTIAWKLSGEDKITYALEGGAFMCGAIVQWLRDQMGFIKKSHEIEALAEKVNDTDGVFVIPAFTGLGAPYWKPESKALIGGLTRGSHKGHIARASLEAMAWQNVDIIKSMEKDLKSRVKQVKVDGGAVENSLLLQLQSDFLGVPVYKPKNIESTVLGAGFVAGLGSGVWKSKRQLAEIWELDKKFKSKLSVSKRNKAHQIWLENVKKVF